MIDDILFMKESDLERIADAKPLERGNIIFINSDDKYFSAGVINEGSSFDIFNAGKRSKQVLFYSSNDLILVVPYHRQIERKIALENYEIMRQIKNIREGVISTFCIIKEGHLPLREKVCFYTIHTAFGVSTLQQISYTATHDKDAPIDFLNKKMEEVCKLIDAYKSISMRRS